MNDIWRKKERNVIYLIRGEKSINQSAEVSNHLICFCPHLFLHLFVLSTRNVLLFFYGTYYLYIYALHENYKKKMTSLLCNEGRQAGRRLYDERFTWFKGRFMEAAVEKKKNTLIFTLCLSLSHTKNVSISNNSSFLPL